MSSKPEPYHRPRWIEFDLTKVRSLYGENVQYHGQRLVRGKIIPVYFQPNPDKEKGHSNFFGLFYGVTADLTGEYTTTVYICDGQHGKVIVKGVMVKSTGQILISQSVHDMHYDDSRQLAVDGGQDYLRLVGNINDAMPLDFDLASGMFRIEGERTWRSLRSTSNEAVYN